MKFSNRMTGSRVVFDFIFDASVCSLCVEVKISYFIVPSFSSWNRWLRWNRRRTSCSHRISFSLSFSLHVIKLLFDVCFLIRRRIQRDSIAMQHKENNSCECSYEFPFDEPLNGMMYWKRQNVNVNVKREQNEAKINLSLWKLLNFNLIYCDSIECGPQNMRVSLFLSLSFSAIR